MWMYDFHIFYLGGKAVLLGQSPYGIPDFNGPYPLAVVFAPFALLPEQMAYALFVLFNLFLLYKTLGKRMGWALLSFPVLFTLFVGQVDLLLALLPRFGLPWLLALFLIKPQVGFVLAPFYLRKLDKAAWLKVIGASSSFFALSIALRPSWVSEWLQLSSGMVGYSVRSSNLFWLIPTHWLDFRLAINLFTACIVLIFTFGWVKERQNSWAYLTLVQPLNNIYSTSVLAEWIGPIEVLASWAAVFWVGGDIHAGMPMFLIPLVILARHHYERKNISLQKNRKLPRFLK